MIKLERLKELIEYYSDIGEFTWKESRGLAEKGDAAGYVNRDSGIRNIMVEGKTGTLEHDFVNEDHKGMDAWVHKHNGYATREALELLNPRSSDASREIDARFLGAPTERTRWLRNNVWSRLPPLIRPFFHYFYRYFLRGGFLDGKEAFVYHFLQGLWYPLLIDAKYLEFKAKNSNHRSLE